MAAMGLGPTDISIPKLYWSIAAQRHLSFNEVFASPLGTTTFYAQLTEGGMRLDENSADEILELTLEMFDLLEKPASAEEQLLQSKYQALFTDGHYGYMTAAKAGARFLKRHRNLLE